MVCGNESFQKGMRMNALIGRSVMVTLDQLEIKPLAQRRVNWARVNRLAAAWNWYFFTPPVVVKNGKKYHIADGQHRVLALRKQHPGYGKPFPAWVKPACSAQQEAILFLGLNEKVTASKPADKYAVGRTARDKVARVTEAELRKAGIVTIYRSTRPSQNETRCGHAFAEAYRRLGLEGLRRVIRCVKASSISGTIDPVALQSIYIAGVTEYVARGNGKIRVRVAPETVLRRAGRASLSNGYKRAGAIAGVLEGRRK